jgi:phospholipid/cholesterol/gamma-HCH transport system permease protein
MDNPSSSLKASLIEIIGSALYDFLNAFKYILKGHIEWSQFVHRLVFIGYESLPMILILTSIASMILTLNSSLELANRGGREVIGALIAIADMRELVPVFIAFAIVSRCGTALTAEVSTMKVTEQIDVLRVLKIDPLYYLVAPTILAIIVLSPILLSVAAVMSIFAGMMIAKFSVGLEFAEFLDSAWSQMSLKDYFYPLIKTIIFSLFALVTNLSMGLRCSGGAKEVGEVTTRATALIMVGVIIIDGILTPLLY